MYYSKAVERELFMPWDLIFSSEIIRLLQDSNSAFFRFDKPRYDTEPHRLPSRNS